MNELKSIDSSERCAVSDIWGTKLDCGAAKGYINNSK